MLYRRISRSINPEGYIEDSASYDLSHIRRELFVLRERMKKHLEGIMERESTRLLLQDSYISIRNNRYVIPMKPNFNESLKGIVHDYSHSLKTSFVEPMECVELNNSINILVNEEQEEEKKVLRDLTDFARGFRDVLETNLAIMTELDFYHALSLFSLEFHCVRPEISNEGYLEIKGAVNPFIALSKKHETVPIDIIMEADKQAMIISGPNAGGKTAALKTIGLLSVMAKAGLFIPASGKPVIPIFSNIFALIGDEQDISMELSSFTAHMHGIKNLLDYAHGGELVLIDEIGGATEPQEASALAMAIIDTFIEKGCRVVVTTHLNLIKAYGYTRPFAVNVATSFDSGTAKPLYKLIYGTTGYSNAISVAKNIDLPKEIIEKSYEYLGKQEFMLNDLITSLEQEKKKAERENEELKELKTEVKKRLALIKDKRNEYFAKVEERCNDRLSELEQEIESMRKEIVKREKASATKSKKQIYRLRERFGGETAKRQETINIGDYVMVKTLGSKGRVADIDRNGDTYEVVVGNARMKLKRFFVEKTTAEKGPVDAAQDRLDVEKVSEPTLNVVGMRVEEALHTLDKFLDRAIVEGMSRVKIVHGVGTGTLMQAIREHMGGLRYIKSLQKTKKIAALPLWSLCEDYS